MTESPFPKKRKWRFGLLEFIQKWTSEETVTISQEEVDYFREHPDEIDDFSSPSHLHMLFLWLGLTLGVFGVGVSKVLAHSGVLTGVPEGVAEFLTDIVFEIGVSLIGAAIVTFMLSVVMNRQQQNALKWREAIRERIATAKKEG